MSTGRPDADRRHAVPCWGRILSAHSAPAAAAVAMLQVAVCVRMVAGVVDNVGLYALLLTNERTTTVGTWVSASMRLVSGALGATGVLCAGLLLCGLYQRKTAYFTTQLVWQGIALALSAVLVGAMAAAAVYLRSEAGDTEAKEVLLYIYWFHCGTIGIWSPHSPHNEQIAPTLWIWAGLALAGTVVQALAIGIVWAARRHAADRRAGTGEWWRRGEADSEGGAAAKGQGGAGDKRVYPQLPTAHAKGQYQPGVVYTQ